jgi:hypothetical protein
LVRRIGHLKSYRCASKNPGARVRIESARPKHVFCRRRESVPACWPCTIPASAERMACPIGHITCSRFGSRNRSVCPDSGRARTKTHDGAHDCCGETWSGRTVPRGSDLRPRAGRADRSGPPARGPLPGCPADGRRGRGSQSVWGGSCGLFTLAGRPLVGGAATSVMQSAPGPAERPLVRGCPNHVFIV